jgi:phosphatidylglycerophosphate synthase
MVDWHLGMLDDRERLGVANVVTLVRAGLVPAVAILGASPTGLALFMLAGAGDVLDGVLARSRGETTRLGLWLDGAVDSLMLSAVAMIALPAWAAAIVVGRYALPWFAIGGVYFLRARRPPLGTLVSGRVPGLVCFAGLVLSLAGVRIGAVVAVAGALGGLGTFTASAVRSRAAVV